VHSSISSIAPQDFNIYLGYREESEKVSELKSVSGSNKLPYGTLALGSEGIKDAITGFEDAYVFIFEHPRISFSLSFLTGGNRISRTSVCRRTFSTQKKARHTHRNPKHHRNPMLLPSHRQALPQALKPPSAAAPSPTSQHLQHPLSHHLLLEVRHLSAAMAGRLAWVQQ
jgi:hypothetical protein